MQNIPNKFLPNRNDFQVIKFILTVFFVNKCTGIAIH